MKKKYLPAIPRLLTILFIAFISMFALDVFSEGYTPIETLFALFMHLIPSFVLIFLLVIAWKDSRTGGIIFILISIAFTLAFNTYRNIFSLLLISGTPLLFGVLFLLSPKKNVNGKD